MTYYGAFYRSALYPLLTRVNAYLLRWLREKHPRLRGRKRHKDARARACQQRPRYFAHGPGS
jgi:RNA-directed DNA polymerase